MATLRDEDQSGSKKKPTISVYVQAERVETLHLAAHRVNYETKRSKAMSPSALARYTLDNFLEAAVEKLIAESKIK